MRVIVLLNPDARTVENEGPAALGDRIARAFSTQAIEAQVEFATGNDWRRAAENARRAIERGQADALIVGGGDGSLSTAASVIVDTGIPLGILPLGTFNHFARDIGIGQDLDQAISVIAAGKTAAIDLGEVNGQAFVNNSSVGLYSILVIDRERRRQQRLSKWAAMVLSCFRLLRRFSLRRLTISAAGQRMSHRTPLLFVGNNPYRLRPPAFGTRERLDSGRLWICCPKQQTLWQLVWLACRAFAGLRIHLHDLEIIMDSAAEIDSRASRLPVALDGEVMIMRPPLSYRIRPGALRVFTPNVPAGSAPAAEPDSRSKFRS